MIKQPLKFSHDILKDIICKGDTVIDATVGNGHDTVLLASLVESTGKVYGFDIQKNALEETKSKLLLTGLLNRTELIHDGHENIDNYLPSNLEVSAVVFNLGYLPKGDKSIITQPETTISAISQSLNRLRRGGIISIMVYYGHEGGLEEKKSVKSFVKDLDQNNYNVLEYKFINQKNNAPYLYVVEKR